MVVLDRHGGGWLRRRTGTGACPYGWLWRVRTCTGPVPTDGCVVFGEAQAVHMMAESEGFEPPDLLQSTVFKTAAFDRSANSPVQVVFGADYI